MIPIKDRLVIKRFKAPDKLAKSGIILQTQNVEPPNMGLVKFVGPEVKEIQPGHIVAVGTKWFTEFALGDEKYVVCNEPDIIGIIDKSDLDILAQKFDIKPMMEALEK